MSSFCVAYSDLEKIKKYGICAADDLAYCVDTKASYKYDGEAWQPYSGEVFNVGIPASSGSSGASESSGGKIDFFTDTMPVVPEDYRGVLIFDEDHQPMDSVDDIDAVHTVIRLGGGDNSCLWTKAESVPYEHRDISGITGVSRFSCEVNGDYVKLRADDDVIASWTNGSEFERRPIISLIADNRGS